MEKDEVTLSCEKDYTVFRFRNYVIWICLYPYSGK